MTLTDTYIYKKKKKIILTALELAPQDKNLACTYCTNCIEYHREENVAPVKI